VYADELVTPWYDAARELVPGVEPFDIHTHTGWKDPDGFALTADRLVEALELIGGQAAVFTLADPDGYPEANDRILAEAAASGGRLVPFCRVDPRTDGRAEAERALAAGARGIKLHPRAENFRLADPEVEPVIALADERRLPVIVHAGRGIPALGRDAVDLARRYPGMRLILAHSAVCDLAWIWREAAELPNLFFDTAWWNTSDLLTLFAFVPPGQILFGSDAPYGTPLHSYTMALRCALHAGLDADAVRSVMGGQARRLLAGEAPVDLGPAPGPERAASSDLLLERVYEFLISALNRGMAAGLGGPSEEAVALARLACEVGNDAPQAPVCRSVLAVLDRHEQFMAEPAGLDQLDKTVRLFPALHLLVMAATIARTPAVPVPQPEPEDVAERQTG
jgi:predicted TIM-barrel fold metal-dependent hydrolase